VRRLWPRIAKVYWDPWLNIPIIKPKQEEIDLFYMLKLSEPGDARPAFRGDLERLKEALKYEFGDLSLYSKYINGKFILLNKVPHWDLMYEVVVSGNVIGQLYYDPFREKWRFRLTYQGAYLAVQLGFAEAVVCTPPFYADRVISGKYGGSARQVVVLDPRGNIRAVGEARGDSGLIIVKTFHERVLPIETSEKTANIDFVLSRNIEGLEILEEKSTRFLERLNSRFNLKPVVSFSGGKDSLVALDLARRVFGEVELVFNDTGLELPETLRNVEEVFTFYGFKVHYASAGDIFWKAVEVFGPPGKDYRWCCKVAKLTPIAKLTRAMWPSGALNIVGQRAYESLDRARSPLVWRNKWVSHMLSTTPIQYWGQLACWLYIHRYKLPYNKLYEEGFDRLGCYLCPSSALAEYREIERLYPELWSKWWLVLESWREKLQQPLVWSKLGLWRWLTPATAKKRIVAQLENYQINWREEYEKRLAKSKISIYPVKISREESRITVEFSDKIIPEHSEEIFLNNAEKSGFNVSKQNGNIELTKGNLKVAIRGKVLVALLPETTCFEDFVDVVKNIYRLRACVLCGSCVVWSPRGSVKLTLRGPELLSTLDERSTRIFIEVCPVSDQLVEKIVISLILGDYKSFKRKSRRKLHFALTTASS
jgi:phosphoadenosine phosphosulfate reductase